MVAVVDDDASLRRSLRNLLSSVGIAVEVFSSGEDFLQSAVQSHVSCLVLDLRMPGMSGFELVDQLHRLGTRIPIVIVTALADIETRTQCLELGVHAFVGKPFLGDDLLQAVKGALAT